MTKTVITEKHFRKAHPVLTFRMSSDDFYRHLDNFMDNKFWTDKVESDFALYIEQYFTAEILRNIMP